MLSYEEWNHELMEALTKWGSTIGRCVFTCDSKVMYDWGWKPNRAARAMLTLNYNDYLTLRQEAVLNHPTYAQREQA